MLSCPNWNAFPRNPIHLAHQANDLQLLSSGRFALGLGTQIRPQIENDSASTGSTPAYRPVLELHGWGELQPELNALSKQGRWREMAGLIDDEMLSTIAARGTSAEVAAEIRHRVGGISDRVCHQPFAPSDRTMGELIGHLVGAH